MAYGRLSVARENFLSESLLVSYRPSTIQPTPLPPPRNSDAFRVFSRNVFRAADRIGARQAPALVSRDEPRAAHHRGEGGDAQRHPQQ
jgi:hypothetical protein